MFFLQTLQHDSGWIEEIELSDDNLIRHAVGVGKGFQKTHCGHSAGPPASVDHPIGSKPTWSQIISALGEFPLVFMKTPEWDREKQQHALAVKLFIQFT